MKTIIKILILSITLSFSCNAQTRSIQRTLNLSDTFLDNHNHINGDYIKDNLNQLNAFEGNWVYNDGNGTIFTVQLRKKIEVLNDTSDRYHFSDMLILTYKLVKNGVLLFDNLNTPLPNEILKTGQGTFGYYRLYDNNDFNKLWGSFHDEIYNIIADCTIKKVPTPAGTPEKISFDLYNAWRKNDPSFYQGLPSTFGVPDNVVLIKQ